MSCCFVFVTYSVLTICSILDVSAYTYERTVLMEQRTQVFQSFGNELSVMEGETKPDELNVRRM